ncbi:hypothetical protein SMU57_02768 [Streptococcus mutans NMT4863]|nr:hypothetical protein SMU57_02768 [Streptococcus mutans NMT4863]
MLNIRLVSNLKNHFSEVEAEVIQNKKISISDKK